MIERTILEHEDKDMLYVGHHELGPQPAGVVSAFKKR
jgi:hypothetical protein